MADQSTPGEQLSALLLEKIANDRFPSATMMEMVERNLSSEQREQYLRILLEKVQGDRFPSIDLMQRIERLSA